MRPCRGAEALGYGMQSPPARAMADYFLKDHNFGLHSARSGRLARHGRLRQGSTCLRTAIIRDAGVEALGALGDARAFEAVLSCLIDLDTLTKSVPSPVKRRLTLHPPDAASASQFRRVLVASMLAEQATRP